MQLDGWGKINSQTSVKIKDYFHTCENTLQSLKNDRLFFNYGGTSLFLLTNEKWEPRCKFDKNTVAKVVIGSA